MTFDLLDTSRGDLLTTTEFHAINNAHGVYDALRFVVRLSPKVHDLISSLPPGIGFKNGATQDQIKAFSTYLHETIHWWQHIGSTSGFMLSLSYPAQTHANLNHLRHFLDLVGPVKSIRSYAEIQTGQSLPGTAVGLANTIINNQFDIEAFRLLVTNPERAESLVTKGMFESVGHTYNIALAQGVFALASTFDKEFTLLPDPRDWEKEYQKLRAAREPGFYHGSPVELSPIGAYHIFEGQARFAQLQYLHFASGGAFDWKEADDAGMMSPTYTLAFDAFLTLTELERPPTINHPIIGLFLLICDVAINPGEAFPLPVRHHKTLISDIDPGTRFIHLSAGVRLFCPETAHEITQYNATEYELVVTKLCGALRLFSPMDNCRAVDHWLTKGDTFREALDLHSVGKTNNLNMPLQLLFGQFASFTRDKLRHPHLLCWPGAAMAGPHANEAMLGIFSRQSPLFIDRSDDTMIVPIVRQGLSEVDVLETFQQFYNAHALYDLTKQWINSSGPYNYDYAWLQPNGTEREIKEWADRIFTNVYGVSPDGFDILI